MILMGYFMKHINGRYFHEHNTMRNPLMSCKRFTASFLIIGILLVFSFSSDAQIKIARDPKFALPANAMTDLIKHYEDKPDGPYQVMVEIIIFEVFMRNEDKIGFVYNILGEVGEFRGNNLNGLASTESDLSVLGSGGRDLLLPSGLNIVSNIFESNDEDRVEAVIQALAEDQTVQVYSNPRLLTLDGVPARLETGEEIPFLERKNLGTSETFSTNFRKSGVTMQITPFVRFTETDIQRKKPYIIVDLDVSLSSISRYREEEGFTQPIVDDRNLTNRVTLKAGQRIIVASLYRDTQENTMRGIPILKDLPVLGRLFKGTTNMNQISQLFIMVKPDLFDYSGELLQKTGVLNPEQESKGFRKILEKRTQALDGRSGPFEEFRSLFLDRNTPR